MPRLSIVLLTYNRLDYAKQTISALMTNAIYPGGTVRLHIADDGSPDHDNYVAAIIKKVEEYSVYLDELGIKLDEITVTNAERGGYGKNYNLACQVVHDLSDFIMPLEDDWVLRYTADTPLDLSVVTAALADPRIGCVRLGYLGYTQRLYGEVIDSGGRNWLLLDSDSPEPHVFAGHPRVETVAWQRQLGAWPEGIAPGATEWEVAHRPEARTGVVWPMELGHPLFEHIGTIRTIDLE